MKKRKGLLFVVGVFFVLILISFINAADLSISTCAQLKTICTAANYNGNHVITQDITCTGTWIPICRTGSGDDMYFAGTLNGNYHTISGVDIDFSTNMNYIGGLVGVLNGGTLQNIYLDLVKISGPTAVGGGTRWVGGLVGQMQSGTISNVGVTGGLINAGDNNIGGLVGEQVAGTITRSFATNNIQGSWAEHGGLVGLQTGGAITNSFAIGNVQGNDGIGGLVGNAHGTITNCFARGDATATANRAGGLVGRLYGGVGNSYATGAGFGVSDYGGLVGVIETGGTTTNCFKVQTTGSAIGTQQGVGRLFRPSHNVYTGSPVWNLAVWEFKSPYFNYPSLIWSDYEVNKPHLTLTSCNLLSSELLCNLDMQYSQIYLGNNINCNGVTINPQCDLVDFEGVFDGRGHTVSNFKVINSVSYTAFLGQVTGGSIRDLTLGIDSITGTDKVGGLIGYFIQGGRIINVHIQSNGNGEVVGSTEVGGLVGFSHSTRINDSSVNLTKVSSGGNSVGGLIGTNFLSIITNCTVNISRVEATGDYVGGLVGLNGNIVPITVNGGKITDCHVIMHDEGTGVNGINYVGGLVGYNYDDSVGTNYALINKSTTNILVSGTNQIGGIAGYSNDPVTWSNASGNVSGIDNVGGIVGLAEEDIHYCNYLGDLVTGSQNVGGLAGSATEDIEMSNSFGKVSGTSYVGGAAGQSTDHLFNVFVFGDVSATQDYVGGIIGVSNDKIVNCSAKGDVSGRDYVGGLVGKPNADINKSTAWGEVSGRNYVGGFFGWQDSGGDGDIIENSYARGNIVCNSKCGGFGSVQRAKISNCYARGEMQGIELGGFVYDSQADQIKNCFTVSNIIGEGRGFYYLNTGGSIINSYYTGTPGHPILTGEPIKEDNKDDFKYKNHDVYDTINPKWNFIHPWGIIEGETYPYLVYIGVCGDTVCSLDENCETCPSDCGCTVGAPYCFEGECVECTSSSQCSAGQVCENNQCVTLQVGEIKWQNMMKADITSAHIGDTVLIYYENGSGSDYFEVKEGSTLLKELREVFEKGVHLLAKLILIKGDLGGSGPWSLNAYSKGGIEKGSTNPLSVSTTYDNARPSALLESPLPEKNYVIGNSGKTGYISFENIISDEDDDLKVNWNYGDGNSKNILNCLTTENCNETYRYAGSGTKTVILKINEIEPVRNQRVVKCSRVFVYAEGYNVFPIIDKPSCGTLLTGIGYHDIDGDSSHVKYCDFDQADCNAHRTSQGIGGSCAEIDDDLGGDSIWCYVSNSSSDLRFRWTFDGVIDTEHTDNINFQHFFNTAHDHTVNLKVFIEVP